MKPDFLPLAAAGAIAAVLFFGKDRIHEEITVMSDSFTRFDPLFKKYGALNNVPWKWLKAIAMNESSLGEASSVAWGLDHPSDVEGSKSSDGKSWGLMQMTVPTARDYDLNATPEKLNNPEYSVSLAARFLAALRKQVPMSARNYDELVFKSYNQGWGNSRKEMLGIGGGFANPYWERIQRNLSIINRRQPEA